MSAVFGYTLTYFSLLGMPFLETSPEGPPPPEVVSLSECCAWKCDHARVSPSNLALSVVPCLLAVNSGDYITAVCDRNLAENISRVLYPNDNVSLTPVARCSPSHGLWGWSVAVPVTSSLAVPFMSCVVSAVLSSSVWLNESCGGGWWLCQPCHWQCHSCHVLHQLYCH